MVDPWVHEIARQRHQDLLARAERYRLGRIARYGNTDRQTASSWLNARVAFGMARLRQAFRAPIATEPKSERGRNSEIGDGNQHLARAAAPPEAAR